jgi:hypothetical protein
VADDDSLARISALMKALDAATDEAASVRREISAELERLRTKDAAALTVPQPDRRVLQTRRLRSRRKTDT